MNATSDSPAPDQQSGKAPTVTKADNKCAFNVMVQCRLINDAAAVIAAHREQAVAEETRKLRVALHQARKQHDTPASEQQEGKR